MGKLPPLNLDLEPVYLPLGRKSHPNEKRDQKHTEREQREGTLAWVTERIRRDRRGQLAVQPWLFDDETGLNAQRPKYQERLAEARRLRAEGRKVYFVVRMLDRLGRDAEELHRCYKELLSLDVELVAVDMGGTIAPEVFPYLVANAHVGSLKISANVKRINAQVRRDGWWRPARVPWGYEIVPTTDAEQREGAPKVKLAIDDVPAKRVREAFARVAKGEAVNALSRWIAGLPDAERGGYQTKDGWRWRVLERQALRQLFRSRVYVGQQPDGAPGNWPVLVDPATWQAAQSAMDGAKTGMPKQASGEYLLTGRLWCPVCGAQGAQLRMRGGVQGGQRAQRRYRCSAEIVGARALGACYYSVLAESADRDVRRQITPLLRAAGADRSFRRDVERALRELLAEGQAPKSDVAARLAAVDAEIGDVQAKADVLLDRLERKLLRDGEFTRRISPLRAREDHLQAQRAELAELVAREQGPAGMEKLTAAGVLRHLDDWAARWESEDRPTQRGVLAELVARIEPVRGPVYGEVRCHVEWTEEGRLLAATAQALGLSAREGQQLAGDGQGEAAAS